MANKNYDGFNSVLDNMRSSFSPQDTTKKGKPHPTATPEEKRDREAMGNTQGKKGCKMERINMAFTTENYEFIGKMSRFYGKTMTKFVNQVITDYRKQFQADNPEFFSQNLKLKNELIFDDSEN